MNIVHADNSKKEHFEAMLAVAGFKVKRAIQLANNYWPECDAYERIRSQNPWWLFATDLGMLIMGRRKRVYELDWSLTDLRHKLDVVDRTTNDIEYTHAWTDIELIGYMKQLRDKLTELLKQGVK